MLHIQIKTCHRFDGAEYSTVYKRLWSAP